MISFELTDEERILHESVRTFARDAIRPMLRAFETHRDVGSALRAGHHGLGLSSLQLPESIGGAGLGETAGVITLEGLGFGDAGIAVALDVSHPAATVVRELGDAAQQAAILAPLVADGAHLALCLSERDAPGVGCGVRAVRDGDGWRVTGRKDFVAEAQRAQSFLVVAQVDEAAGWNGLGVFIVPAGQGGVVPAGEGVSVGERHDLVGLQATSFYSVEFVGARASMRLAGDDDTLVRLSGALVRAALHGAAVAIGVSRASYEAAVRYADERHAFGKPIGHFQAIAFLLSDMAMEIDAARWLLWRAAAFADAGNFDVHTVAMALQQAHQAAGFVTERAVQIFGGAGFMRDHPVEKWMRDAKALAMYVSTPELMSALSQSAVLGEWAPAPEDALPISSLQPVLS